MEILFLLPIEFLILVLSAAIKPNPRIALMEPADRRSFLWGIVLVSAPASAIMPLLMYFLFAARSGNGLDWPIVAGLAILAVVAVACLVTGLSWTRRALASVPVGKLKPSVGEDDLA